MGFSVMLRGAEKLEPVEYWCPYGTPYLAYLKPFSIACVIKEKIAVKSQNVILKYHRNCSLSELHERMLFQNIQFQWWVM